MGLKRHPSGGSTGKHQIEPTWGLVDSNRGAFAIGFRNSTRVALTWQEACSVQVGNTNWMGEILHHFEIKGNHCWLVFAQGNHHSRVVPASV